jgi:HKD family nuclease
VLVGKLKINQSLKTKEYFCPWFFIIYLFILTKGISLLMNGNFNKGIKGFNIKNYSFPDKELTLTEEKH